MSTLLATDPATKFGADIAAKSENEVAETVAREAVLKAMDADTFTSAEDLQKVYQSAFEHAVTERKMFSRGRTS